MGAKAITIYQGDALTINVTIKDNGSNVLNLTLYNEMYFTIRENISDVTNVLQKKLTTGGITVISATKGQIRIVLLNEDTKVIEPDKYYYEIAIEDTSEDTQYIVVQDFFTVKDALVV